ncbi:hypothetical protein [Stenotrophomonas maltophilia]|uniref:hypothetical protein n=1 Tax=Stenotrophomonas maltophilia TaxID=40324 RepID=UPI000810B413|nr:hypothetical protein [Stenotrophomonas maltophilia]MCU1064333.1 hypothetical protein [Stenotrophomonas maltophilia]OCK46533.1 hypothetical protein BA766_13655 [Stenotrophomonas maltophilia]PJK95729.1 hypothetical protein B9Y63_19625 [Stenotrophomonas maltophilia]
MAKSHVLYARQGTGKSLYGQAIAESMGLQHVIDLDDVQLFGDRLRREGCLYLSSCMYYAERAATLLRTPVIQVEDALAAIGVHGKGVAHG